MFVICWSGTVAVFSYEVDWLLSRNLRSEQPGGEIAWGKIYRNAVRAHPDWSVAQINGPLADGYAAEVWLDRPDGIPHRLYSDPRNGEVIGEASYFNVQRFFRSLHMSLFISGWPILGIPFGYLAVGILSIPLLASLVTSLVFYRRWWRRLLKLEWQHGRRVLWSDLHKLAGLWSLWFIVLIGVTGLWYLLEWKLPVPPAAPASVHRGLERHDFLPIDELVRRAREAYPELDIRVLSTWQMGEGIFEAQGQDGSLLVRNRAAKVWLDPTDGDVRGVQRVADLSLYERWIEMADTIHFGSFGGLWSKFVWFLFGLLLSGLCLTGAYLQAQRQKRRGKPEALRVPISLSYAATIAILLAACGFGYAEVKGYGLDGQLPEVPIDVTVFLLIWISTTVAALTAWMLTVR